MEKKMLGILVFSLWTVVHLYSGFYLLKMGQDLVESEVEDYPLKKRIILAGRLALVGSIINILSVIIFSITNLQLFYCFYVLGFLIQLLHLYYYGVSEPFLKKRLKS